MAAEPPRAANISAIYGAASGGTFLGLPSATIAEGARAHVALFGAATATPYPDAGAYCANAPAAIRAGMPPAPAWYAGKMLECGATPSIPKGHDCLIVGVRPDGIVAEPLNPKVRDAGLVAPPRLVRPGLLAAARLAP